MTDTTAVAARYRHLADEFAAKVAAVPAERWSDPTPCEDWDARQLVGHLVDTQGMFLGFVGQEIPAGPSVADDPLGAWQHTRSAVQAELDDPERAAAGFDGFAGPTTLAEAVDRFLCFDLVVHGWDLAHATGLDETIDPVEVQRVMDGVAGFGDMLYTNGVCKDGVEAPAGADEQTRLLAILGRQA